MRILYRKFQPVDYVIVMKNGKRVKEGIGLTVLGNSMRIGLIVAPATAYDGTFAFDDLVTADYQSICVQGAVTYMISDYGQAARMADFSYTNNYKEKQAEAMKLIGQRINNIIKAIVIREAGSRVVREIVKQADCMAGLIMTGLQEDQAVGKLGVRILAVNVLGVIPKPETRKALEAAAREEILKEQDDAIYKRRNSAIEQERLIRENELQTEIRVAEKEKEKKEKEQEIKRRLMQTELDMEQEKQERQMQMKQTELQERIRMEEKNREYVDLEVENEKKKADEKAYEMAEMMKAYENVNVALIEALALAKVDPKTLMAKAFMEMGENAGKIGTLNMTPDLLESIVSGKR